MAKKLVWNNGDADEIAASDFVGAVLHAGTTELTTTLNGAKQSLDVHVSNGIAVDLDGDYNVSTNATPDSVGVIGHDRSATPGLTGQNVRPTGGALSADALVAANVHGLDVGAFGHVFNGTTWDRLRGTSGAVHIADGGNVISIDDAGGSLTVDGTVTVTATQLDIDDLNATDDAVQAWAFDGTGSAIGSTAGALDVSIANASLTVSDAALANTAVVSSQLAATATEAALPTLSARKYLNLVNMENQIVYLGPTGTDDTDGFPIYPGVYQEYRAGASIALYQVCKTGKTSRMAYLELS